MAYYVDTKLIIRLLQHFHYLNHNVTTIGRFEILLNNLKILYKLWHVNIII